MSAQNVNIRNWEEIRFAYQVAKLGTLSAAADALGVHHATVIRHIDALEARLGVKLFQRHARGYLATEAGRDLLKVATATEDGLAQMVGRIRGRGSDVSGELVVTMLAAIIEQTTPILAEFMALHPDLQVSVIADDRALRLEYGEAHVALRAGQQPQEPDNVVQELIRQKYTLFAHKEYVEKHGRLEGLDKIEDHKFIGPIDKNIRAPFAIWMADNIPDTSIVYRVNTQQGLVAAIRCGVGMGFMSLEEGYSFPDLVKMTDPMPEWQSTLWIVTHRDLHRTAKVQAFTAFLKTRVKL